MDLKFFFQGVKNIILDPDRAWEISIRKTNP
jgi:hypothetical protein